MSMFFLPKVGTIWSHSGGGTVYTFVMTIFESQLLKNCYDHYRQTQKKKVENAEINKI